MATDEGTKTSVEADAAGGAGRPAAVIGVLGAGTMGAGIAQLAARSGAQTLLYDPFPEAPERLELKHEMYAKLSQVVSERCVLATNTSSLLVTAIATGATHPERVVGMHFFNPAPLMRLLEVVAGVESSPRALAIAQATGEAMGKTVIVAKDGT